MEVEVCLIQDSHSVGIYEVEILLNKARVCVYVHAQSLIRVRLFVTPWTAACQAPLSMGILLARILEWVAMPSSRGSSQPRSPAL